MYVFPVMIIIIIYNQTVKFQNNPDVHIKQIVYRESFKILRVIQYISIIAIPIKLELLLLANSLNSIFTMTKYLVILSIVIVGGELSHATIPHLTTFK